MPPAKKTDVCVVLFDVGAESDFLEKARSAFLDLCAEKMFTNSGDLVKLVLFNTEGTKHSLARFQEGYENIMEVTEDALEYNPHIVNKYIEGVKAVKKANWLKSIQVAIHVLTSTVEDITNVVAKQILFITDFSTPLDSQDGVQKIIQDLNRNDIYLYIVGPKIEIPHMLNSFDDIRLWKKKLVFEEPNENTNIVKRIINSAPNSIVCDFTISMEMFKFFKTHKGLQPWLIPLSIGTLLQIPTSSTRMNRPTYTTMKEDKKDGATWRWVDADDTTKDVPYTNVISGYEFHGKFIALTEEVKKSFKDTEPKGFTILGFTNIKNVPQHYLCGEATYGVTGDYREPDSYELFYTLIDRLFEKNMCIITSKIYANNFQPKLMVLIPKPHFEPKCFVCAELPHADDVRVKFKENEGPAPKLVEESDLKKSVYTFLDSLDLQKCSGNEVPISPLLSRDLYLSRLNHKLLENFLGKEQPYNVYNLLNVDMSPDADDLLKFCPKREQKHEDL